MNHIEELLVVKRSGEVVNFDLDRISNAIKAAIDAGDEKYDANAISNIVDSIHKEIDERFTEFYPNVENIQDIVEKHYLKTRIEGMKHHEPDSNVSNFQNANIPGPIMNENELVSL